MTCRLSARLVKLSFMLMISKFIFALLNQVIGLSFSSAWTEFLTGPKCGSCVSPMINVNYYELAILILVMLITLENHVITPSDAVCDLSVNIHSSLKPSFHISTIVRKVNIRLKLILRCFLHCNPDNFIGAFIVYVCPSLKYNYVIWNPWFLQDINLIESVQRSFTRQVCLICHLALVSYAERLPMFKLERLKLRRLHKDLTNLFKIV